MIYIAHFTPYSLQSIISEIVYQYLQWLHKKESISCECNHVEGFRKGEFKVQVDKLGKLTVKGRRSLGDGKFMHLERVFAVPKDTPIEKISGKFEGGCLSLFMPKKEETVPQTAVSSEKLGSVEPTHKDEPVAGDKKEETPIQEGQPESSARTEEEPVQKVMAKDGEETKAAAPAHEEKKPAAPVYEEKPLTDEKKEEHLIQDEPIQKKQPMSSPVSDDRFEKYKKKGLAWKETIVEETEWCLDDGLIDGLLETISKNKKVIAIAVAAFATGFFVSQKLRSCGR